MATITDLAKKVRNTTTRLSQFFIRGESVDETGGFSVAAVDTGNNVFEISGDETGNSDFADGERIYLVGSTANDRFYTIDSTTFGGSNTEISVKENVKDGTDDGTIYTSKEYTFYNMGRIQGADFTSDPVTSEMDQDGRQSTQIWEATVSFTMQQASNEELAMQQNLALPDSIYGFYGNGHTLYVSGSKQVTTAEVNNGLDSSTGVIDFGTGAGQLDDPNGMVFKNALLNPSPQVNLSGDVALIEIEFTGRLELDAFESLETDQTITISAD